MNFLIAHPHDYTKCSNVIHEDIHFFPGKEREDMLKELKNAITRQEVIIAKDEETICGILIFSRDKSELDYLDVLTAYRDRGIAHAMFNYMVSLFQVGTTIKVISFRADDENPSAAPTVAFYKDLGFKPSRYQESAGYPSQEYVYTVKPKKIL